jgi:cytochrome c oxidase assembly protein subunit 15
VRDPGSRSARIAGAVLGAVLVTQLVLGPAMVLARLSLPLATAHNGVAALLLLATVGLLRTVTPAAVRNRGR